jgi:orotidine-5'-phosphate decarboxylase
MEKQEKIINLTPHSVMINGIEIKSSGVVRLQERNENVGMIAGIPTIRQVRGEPEGLPEAQEGIWIIVSRPIFDALPDRKDLLAIGETIRDSQGRIVGAKNLVVRQ